MVVWSGWGILAVVFAALGAIAGIALVDGTGGLGYGVSEEVGFALGLIVAAAVNWFVCVWLNRRPGRQMVDVDTGERIILRRRHRLFWVPMQYWSVAMLVFAVLAVTSSHVPQEPSAAGSQQPG